MHDAITEKQAQGYSGTTAIMSMKHLVHHYRYVSETDKRSSPEITFSRASKRDTIVQKMNYWKSEVAFFQSL